MMVSSSLRDGLRKDHEVMGRVIFTGSFRSPGHCGPTSDLWSRLPTAAFRIEITNTLGNLTTVDPENDDPKMEPDYQCTVNPIDSTPK